MKADTANRCVMEQGLVVISDSEIKCTTKLGDRETLKVFARTYKVIDVAVRNYLTYYVVKEYQILIIVNHHPDILHSFGVVRGNIP